MEGLHKVSKVFYAYTPYPTEEMKELGIFERATIAARLIESKNEKFFEYGISICSAGDNFNKTIGKELAAERLARGFGRTKWNSYYQSIADFYAEDDYISREAGTTNDGTERATIQYVNDLSKSVFLKIEKYKRKLGDIQK